MWQVEVPLGEFYDAVVEAGRGAKYLALLTALVREADSASFYEDISRYWDSLHDVTGSDVLFVLAGPEASSKVRYHGLPDGREPVAYSSQGAAVVSARERPLRPRLSHWAARAGTSYAPPAAELARSQTLSIGQLRRRLGVSEGELPCLHLAFIGYRRRHESLTIPISGRTVYESVKEVVSRFDEGLAAVRRSASRLEQLERSRQSKFRNSWYYPDGNDCSPQQLEAARAIVAACAGVPPTPNAIAAARAECFRLLALLKGTSQFRSLQRHIDIHLDHQGALTRLGIERDIAATASELETAWEAVLRLRTGVATISALPDVKHRIFIAYHSTDRWIAEHLHSALARHTPTFLDVRCLRPGDRWVERIRAAQDNAEVTVVLVGASGATSWFQQAEYLRAIELARSNKQRLVPVYTSGSPASVPYGLEGIQGVVTTWASGLREDDVRKTAAEIAALVPNL